MKLPALPAQAGNETVISPFLFDFIHFFWPFERGDRLRSGFFRQNYMC
jgi:hypothetical protein